MQLALWERYLDRLDRKAGRAPKKRTTTYGKGPAGITVHDHEPRPHEETPVWVLVNNEPQLIHVHRLRDVFSRFSEADSVLIHCGACEPTPRGGKTP